MARGVNFGVEEVEGLFYLCSENNGANNVQLVCAFVFEYAKGRFSHDTAQL